MIPYTTPSFEITIPGADLSSARDVYVTVTQGAVTITKSGTDLAISADGKTVSCWLTQEESLQFRSSGKASAQVNWVYIDAVDGDLRRAATNPLSVEVGTQLYKEVIE